MRLLGKVFQGERTDNTKTWASNKLGTCEEKRLQWLDCNKSWVNSIR